MIIPHFKDSDPPFAYVFYEATNHHFSRGPIYICKDENENWLMFSENAVQRKYLIHLIFKKTPKPVTGIMQLIETNDLTNIETAYLLTYPNEES